MFLVGYSLAFWVPGNNPVLESPQLLLRQPYLIIMWALQHKLLCVHTLVLMTRGGFKIKIGNGWGIDGVLPEAASNLHVPVSLTRLIKGINSFLVKLGAVSVMVSRCIEGDIYFAYLP